MGQHCSFSLLSNQVAKHLSSKELTALESNAVEGINICGGRESSRLISCEDTSAFRLQVVLLGVENICYSVEQTEFSLIVQHILLLDQILGFKLLGLVQDSG